VALLNPQRFRIRAGSAGRKAASRLQFPCVWSFGLILLAACVCHSGEPLAAQSAALTENEIKAGFLYNFTKFVEWPEGVYADARSPITLGIAGDNPFGNLLTDTAAGKFVNGRPVVVRQFQEGQDLRSCQVLFIASPNKQYIAHALGKVKGSGVLTVGEGAAFTRSGGMIAFLVEGSKVRLEIDLAAVSEAHLKLSAKVIAVARLVSSEAKEKN
jgi:YfiR/HmsC-like